MSAEIDDQAGQPAPLPADGIAPGRTDHGEDADYFTFHGTPGYLYYFHSLVEPSATQLSVQDEMGYDLVWRELRRGRQFVHVFTSFDSILWSPDVEGTYRLGINADPDSFMYDPVNWSDTYEVVVRAIPLSPLPDPSAPLIAPGQTPIENRSLDSPQWLKFNAIKGAAYSFAASGDSHNQLIQLVDSNGSVLASNNGPFDNVDWLAPATDTFYIRVASIDSTLYSFWMSQHIDDQVDQPATVSLPARIDGRIDYNRGSGLSDSDLFQFHAVGGRVYVLVVVDDSDVLLTLLDKNRKPLDEQFDDDSNFVRHWTAPETGTYYLTVEGRAARTYLYHGPYSLYLAEAPPEEQWGQSSQLNSGEEARGQIYFPFDHHDFRFRVTQRQRFRFSGQLPGEGSLGFWYSEEQEFYVEATRDGHFAGTVTLRPGVYTMTLSSLSTSMGPFTLLAVPVNDSAPDENDDAAPAADDSEDSADDLRDDSSDGGVAYYDQLAVDNTDSQARSDASAKDTSDDWLDDSRDPFSDWSNEVW